MDNSKREKTKRKFDKKFWLFLFLAVLYIAYSVYEYYQSQPVPVEGILYVHMIDCGQGDAILFECNGLYALIDSGPNSGGKEVVDYLNTQHVDKLQFVVGTHPHEDHMGAMYLVLENFDTEKVYIPEFDESRINTKWYKKFKNQINEKNIEIVNPNVGEIFYLDEAKFRVVGQLSADEAGNDYNNYSTVIKVSFGDMDILMTGDAETKVEKAILNSEENIQCEVLKLGHHGSDTSTSYDFLTAVNPSYAIVSCGIGNSYHHPCTETVKKLEQENIPLYRTDEQGDVVLTITDSDISFSTKPGDYFDGDSLAQKRGIVQND